MKNLVPVTLAAGLIFLTGCSEEEQTAPVAPAAPAQTEATPAAPSVSEAETKAALEEANALVAETKKEMAKVSEEADEALKEVNASLEEVKKQVEELKKEDVSKEDVAQLVSTVKVEKDDIMKDLGLSLNDVKAQVADFGKEKVISYANKYKEVILEKKDQILAMKDEFNGLSMSEKIAKGKELKSKLSEYGEQLGALKERYSVYTDKLKDFGVDLSAYGL